MKRLSFLLIIMFALNINAQLQTLNLLPSYLENTPRGEGGEEPVLNFDNIVGTIKGEYGVNDNGAAFYNIPIPVPPGSGGMIPSLNIVYNSQSGDGWLGKGWNVSGFSSISRSTKTFYLDDKVEGLKFDNTDHFALDGNVLIPISGNNGNNLTEYRTEIETYSRIISYSGTGATEPDYFIVQTKDGKILEYGVTSDSRQKLPGLQKTLAWHLNKISDANTNYIIYSYNNDNDNGSFSPNEINYTGNLQASTSPYNTVKFNYSNLPFEKISYLFGKKLSQSTMITNIEIKNNSDIVTKYLFNYEDNFGYLLMDITLQNASGGSFNPTKLDYTYQGIDDFASLQNITNFTHSTGSWDEDTPRFMADVNGDGKDDIVGFGKYDVWVSLSNGQGYEVAEIWFHNGFGLNSGNWQAIASDPNTDATQPRKVVDVNGDGKADIVGFGSDGVWVAISNGSSFENQVPSKWIAEFGSGSNCGNWLNEEKYPRFIVDVNGDKLPDIVGFSEYGIKVAINTGSSFTYNSQWDMSFWGSNAWIFPSYGNTNTEPNQLIRTIADVNGDGLADIVGFHENNIYVSISNGNGFNPITTWLSNNYCIGSNSGGWNVNSTPRYVADINADGMADIIGFGNNGVSVAFSNGLNQFIPQITPTPQGTWSTEFGTNTGWTNNKDFPRMLADINGDGLPDIVGFNQPNVTVSLNRGHDFLSAFTAYNTGGGWNSTDHIRTTADVNGDGRADIVGFGEYFVATGTSQIDDDRKVEKITNGLGFRTKFAYMPINNNTSVYQYSGTETYPFLKFAGSLKVVNYMSTDNGIGRSCDNPSNFTTYKYEDAYAHLKGKGFLGFKKITSINTNDDVINKTVKDNIINYSYCFKSPTSVKSYINSASSPYSETFYSFETVSNQINNIIYSSNLCSTTSLDYILNNQITKQFCFDKEDSLFSNYSGYDEWGNPQTIITTSTDLTLNTDELIQTEKINYTNSRSWCPNAPLNTETIKQTPLNTDDIRRKEFVYDALGIFRKDITDPGDTKETVVEYDYDFFGNPTKKTLSTIASNQLPPVINRFEYDNLGRFVTKKINPLYHEINYTNETKFGNVILEDDENGIKTKFEYDAFGQLIKTTNLSDGNYIKYKTSWITTTGIDIPDFALFQTSSSTLCNSNPDVTMYDKLGRELQSHSMGFNGHNVYTRKIYNAKGQTEQASMPFFDPNYAIWTNFTYDEYGRKLLQENPDNSRISYEYNEKETTIYNEKNGVSQQQKIRINSLNQTIWTEDNNTNPQKVNNKYYSSGLLKETWVDGMLPNQYTTLTYDLQGRRLTLAEPNSGTTLSVYNAYGQLIKQTDARGFTTEMEYDLLGRITKKTQVEGIILYEYDAQPQGDGWNGEIYSITSNWNNGTVKDDFRYNSLGRLISRIETIDGQSYEEKTKYDDCGRIDIITYPDNFEIKHIYATTNGELYQVIDITNNPNHTIWQTESVDNLGNITKYVMGNGLTTNKLFENTTGRLQRIKTDNGAVQNWFYDYDNKGNISSRISLINSLEQKENFTYDNLNRLTGIDLYKNNHFVNNLTLEYDNIGNIKEKTDVGKYEYNSSQINAVTKITNNVSNINTQHDIKYTSFSKVHSIDEDNGAYNMNFYYGPDYSRRKTVFKQSNNLVYTKYFIIGNYEIKTDANGDAVIDHYIYGGDGLAAIYRTTQSSTNMYYIYKDHLGSYDVVTKENGQVVDSYSFDAWGNRRNYYDWELADNTTHLFDRGFTGHEHLDKLGLINMNGRLYDPRLARFLSPDNYVQAPDNTQNFNRYSYCLNNPLIYSDPSGELFWMVIPAIAGVINIAANAKNIHNFGQGLGYFGIGFASGAIGAGVGAGISSAIAGGSFGAGFIGSSTALSATSSFMSGAAIGASAGFAGGFIGGSCNAWASGESFLSGLKAGVITGSLGAIAGGLIGGIAGGTDAAINKRNFWSGNDRGMGRSPFAFNNSDKPFNAFRTRNGGYETRTSVERYTNNPNGTYSERVLRGWSKPDQISNGMTSRINNYLLPSDKPLNLSLSKFVGRSNVQFSGYINEGLSIQISFDGNVVNTFTSGSYNGINMIIPANIENVSVQFLGQPIFDGTLSPFRTIITGYVNW